ncbi:MAG: diadenylate cyclase CdaA [Oscillospiraceae bacterium]|nr:diadenylate cyclase CdaA [Oscillospiraceae bacterium]
MEFIKDFLDIISNVAISMTFRDIIDIMLLTVVIYILITFMRETRAGQLIKGIFLYLVVFFACQQFELRAMTYILESALSVGLITIVIVFQPELRRALERFGRVSSNVLAFGENSERSTIWHIAINEITDACESLSETSTGALIVLERTTRLGEQIETGTMMNAKPSSELLCNIFYPKTPLHDGAVIVRDGMLLAAACYLPKPQKEELINKQLGSRHRAAIGMSENSDAVIIVVSEETGVISIAENGELTRGFDKESLRKTLREKIQIDQSETKKSKKRLKSDKNTKD